MKIVLLVAVAALTATTVRAHEVRPAFLQVEATAPAEYAVVWKQPMVGGRILPITPAFPDGCETVDATVEADAQDALIRRFRLECSDGLHGQRIGVDGLGGTITDVLLQVTLADGDTFSTLLKPSAPTVTVGAEGAPSASYLILGIEHLLFGFDHILFVIALMFFTAPVSLGTGGKLLIHPGALIKTVTAFTAAHSITLSFAALDLARAPQAPVEAMIALSILFLAVEKLRNATDTLTARHTWVVAFAFGLLHGFGFAGALADIGLPKGNELIALVLFNLGVEIGQLGVVAAGIAVIWAVVAFRRTVPPAIIRAPLYCCGSLAAYWLIGRVLTIAS